MNKTNYRREKNEKKNTTQMTKNGTENEVKRR